MTAYTSAIGIASADNLHTGTTAQIVLSGLPVGILGLWASEVADGPETPLPFTLTATQGTVSVTFPYPDLWYVWAKDDNGFGAQSKAVYVGISDDADADKIGLFLRDTLDNNRAGIEAMVQSWYPNTTIKATHYGFPLSVMNFPSIVVLPPRTNWTWFAIPFTQEWNYTFSIACLAQHQNAETEIPMATRMMEACLKILNRRRYLDQTLDGLPLYFCQVNNGEATEMEIDGVGFVTAASLVWTGRAPKMVGSGSF